MCKTTTDRKEMAPVPRQEQDDRQAVTTSQQKKSAPEYAFVERIRGKRNVRMMTVSEYNQKVLSNKTNDDFTFQEYFNGKTMVKPYLDVDVKMKELPEKDELEKQTKQKHDELKELVGIIFPGCEVEYAYRHGPPSDKKSVEDGYVYKISWRAYIKGRKIRCDTIPDYIRRKLNMGPKETHALLDLGVYKGKEQLLGVIYGRKDIETAGQRRVLVPEDRTADPADFLVQAVEDDDDKVYEELKLDDTQIWFKESYRNAKPPAAKKKGKGKEVAPAEVNEAGPSGAPTAPVTEPAQLPESTLREATAFFKERYGIKEDLEDGTIDRKYNTLDFRTKAKWCFIAKRDHGGNNPVIRITTAGAQFICWDEECRSQKAPIAFTALPHALRGYFESRVEVPGSNSEGFPQKFDRSQHAYAELFASWYSDRFIYHDRHIWYFDGHCWVMDEEKLRLRRFIGSTFYEDFLRSVELPVMTEHLKNLQKDAIKLRGALKSALCDEIPSFVPHLEAFDTNPDLFACANGVIDLKTFQMRPARPDDYISMSSPVIYFDEKNAPKLEMRQLLLDILRTIFPVAEELRGIQLLCGYAMQARRPHKIFIVLTDLRDGYNGKSTLIKCLQLVFGLGNYYKKGKPMHLGVDKNASREGHSSNTVKYAGKRIAVFEEFPKTFTMDWSNLKDLTGGDSLQEGRKANSHDGVEFIFSCLIWMAMNLSGLVDFHKADAPTMSRCVTVPFRAKFRPTSEREEYEKDLKDGVPYTYMADPTIDDKLAELGPYFLEWCLEGLKEYRRDPSLNLPASFRHFKDESLGLKVNDGFAAFVENCLIEHPDLYICQRECFDAYKAWCRDNDCDPMTVKPFGIKYKGYMDKKFGPCQKKGGKVNENWKESLCNKAWVAKGIGLRVPGSIGPQE